MNYDQPRVWTLAAFCVASRGIIPHGTAWAATAGGFYAPLTSPDLIIPAASTIARPVYGAIRNNRITISSNDEHNKIMTGLKIAVDPSSLEGITDREADRVMDMFEFIEPTVKAAGDRCHINVMMLMRAIMRDTEADIAA